jgi:hypothetical protein
MSDEPTRPSDDDPGAKYFYLGLGVLLLVLVMLLKRGLGPSALLPVAVGVIGISFNFRPAPVIVLAAVGGLIAYHDASVLGGGFGHSGARHFDPWDFILSTAMLGYVVAHYRLQSLATGIMPVDPRRLTAGQPAPKRDPNSLASAEIGWLLISLPFWALTGYSVWRLLPLLRPANADSTNLAWEGIAAVWVLAAALLLASSLIAFFRWRSSSAVEARLYLQDTLWQETRREQRLLNRWLNRPNRERD